MYRPGSRRFLVFVGAFLWRGDGVIIIRQPGSIGVAVFTGSEAGGLFKGTHEGMAVVEAAEVGDLCNRVVPVCEKGPGVLDFLV